MFEEMMLGTSAIKLLLETYLDVKNIEYSQVSSKENENFKNFESIEVV